MKVFLRVDKGLNQGTKYELSQYGYRAIGRSSGFEETVELSQVGESELDPDDLRLAEEHLRDRQAHAARAEEPMRLSSYRRGRDILLDDDKISRTHAMLFFDEDGPSIVDLRSTNGTFVNGTRRADADLELGDIVNIGKTRFVVEIVEDE